MNLICILTGPSHLEISSAVQASRAGRVPVEDHMKRNIKEIFDAMTRGEIPSAEELDTMHVSLNPGENVARRRQLQDRYPFLGATSIREGLMAFGFECGDGWLPILEWLFAGF
jgi:hypothetical protein